MLRMTHHPLCNAGSLYMARDEMSRHQNRLLDPRALQLAVLHARTSGVR